MAGQSKPTKTASANLHWGERSGRALAAHWHQGAELIGTIALAVAGAPSVIFPSAVLAADERSHSLFTVWGWEQFFFFFGALAVIAGVIRQLTQKPTYGDLRTELTVAHTAATARASAMEAVLRGVLGDLAASIGADTKNCRVNVYCHQDGAFVLLSRVAKNPEWRKRGLSKIPMGWGVVNQAWADGVTVRVNLPQDRDEWEDQMVTDGFPDELTKKFRMQSRSFVGARIEARLPSEKEALGVIILENATPLGVTGRHLDLLLKAPLWTTLQDVMANAKEHFPEIAMSLAEQDPE